ncbi:MAG: hypothetical protein K9N51_14080, partial [Candidatus Pacebacteria bacterium]|nr:hypothetical protein [Candidatus Paceibacterota bacterium]
MRQPRNVRATLAFALILLLVNAAGIGRVNGQEADGKAPVDIEADDYTYDPKTGWATGKGDVHLTYMGMSLEADYVNVNIKTKDVEAQGNIYFSKRQDAEAALVEEGIFIRGEELTGNLDTREFDAGDHKISLGVWYEKGSGAEYEASGKIVMHDVALSTCEYLHEDHAHYSLHAKKVVYSPEGKIRAR